MPLPAVSTLSSLKALDPTLLYVFVAGPSAGETIAVALPGDGWVVIDGASGPDGESLAAALIGRFTRDGDRLRSFILTHPHEDHAHGAAKLLDAYPPDQIVLAARTPEGPHLLACAQSWQSFRESRNTADAVTSGQVIAVLQGIERWERDHPGQIVAAVDGTSLAMGTPAVRAWVRAPAPGAALDQLFAELERANRSRANEASLVLELEFGDTRLVLAGDLPRYRGAGTTAAPTGWDAVVAQHGHLGQAHFVKIPHHGSAGAQHPGLLASPPVAAPTLAERPAALTPYGNSRLPRIGHPDGLARIVGWRTEVHVSAPPADWWHEETGPVVPLGRIRSRHQVQKTGDSFADEAPDIGPASVTAPHGPVWAFALDDKGAVRGRWAGENALLVRA